MLHVIKRIKELLIFCFILSLHLSVIAQTTTIDALLAQLNKNSSDTAQIKILGKLSVAYSSVDPEKKYYYANQYRLLAEKNGIDSLVASAYLDMGNSFVYRSNLDSALHYFKLGHTIAKAKHFQSGIARGYVNIGYVYDRLERKKDAVTFYEEALKIYRKIGLKKGINQCINNLGSIYFDLQQYKIADNYFEQVLENLKETPNDKMSMGYALYSLGGSKRRLGNGKKAMEYYQKSLAIRKDLGDLNGIALSNWGIGQLYVEEKKYHQALDHLEIALKNNRSLQNPYQESGILMAVADAYLGLKDYKNAEENANLALVKAKESNSKTSISLVLEMLTKVSVAKKDYAAALNFKSAFIAVNDSLATTKTTNDVIINDLHRVNTDNKILEKSNKTISAKNSDYVSVISIITLLLIVVMVLLILYYKKNAEKNNINTLLKSQKRELAEVNEELTTQIDIVSAQNIELEKLNNVKNKFFSIVSHDLRSPLNNLQMLFELYRSGDLNEKELGKLLTKLEHTIYTTANFLDNLLEWSKSQLDGMTVKPSVVKIKDIVNENIKLMESQIKLKTLLVENNIEDHITAFVDSNMFNVVVRNLLSNAIKFCNTNDKVVFDGSMIAGKLSFSISDSGPGISDKNKENLFNLTHTTSIGTAGEKGYHIGLILCNDMILQNNGTIEVESQLGEGAAFKITLPSHMN